MHCHPGQLLFACVILQPDLRLLVKRLVVVEPAFTFFPFYFRHLWPSSRIGTALRHSDKNMTDKNRLILTASAYAIKGLNSIHFENIIKSSQKT